MFVGGKNGELDGEPKTSFSPGGIGKMLDLLKPVISRIGNYFLPGLGFVVSLMAAEIGKTIEAKVVGNWGDVSEIIQLEILRQLALNYAFLDRTVFDPAFYLEVNKDVADAYGTTNYTKAKEHWFTTGIMEGRRSSYEFDVNWYLNNHDELKKKYGAVQDYYSAVLHWLNEGIAIGWQSSPDFSVHFYLKNDPELYKQLGEANYMTAFYHWVHYGKKEGRKAIPQQQPISYDPSLLKITKEPSPVKGEPPLWVLSDGGSSNLRKTFDTEEDAKKGLYIA